MPRPSGLEADAAHRTGRIESLRLCPSLQLDHHFRPRLRLLLAVPPRAVLRQVEVLLPLRVVFPASSFEREAMLLGEAEVWLWASPWALWTRRRLQRVKVSQPPASPASGCARKGFYRILRTGDVHLLQGRSKDPILLIRTSESLHVRRYTTHLR